MENKWIKKSHIFLYIGYSNIVMGSLMLIYLWASMQYSRETYHAKVLNISKLFNWETILCGIFYVSLIVTGKSLMNYKKWARNATIYQCSILIFFLLISNYSWIKTGMAFLVILVLLTAAGELVILNKKWVKDLYYSASTSKFRYRGGNDSAERR